MGGWRARCAHTSRCLIASARPHHHHHHPNPSRVTRSPASACRPAAPPPRSPRTANRRRRPDVELCLPGEPPSDQRPPPPAISPPAGPPVSRVAGPPTPPAAELRRDSSGPRCRPAGLRGPGAHWMGLIRRRLDPARARGPARMRGLVARHVPHGLPAQRGILSPLNPRIVHAPSIPQSSASLPPPCLVSPSSMPRCPLHPLILAADSVETSPPQQASAPPQASSTYLKRLATRQRPLLPPDNHSTPDRSLAQPPDPPSHTSYTSYTLCHPTAAPPSPRGPSAPSADKLRPTTLHPASLSSRQSAVASITVCGHHSLRQPLSSAHIDNLSRFHLH